jgi:hypothetical protein
MALSILIWAFPWLMAVFEFLLRSSLNDAGPISFIGPTVGGAALGMMLPFTRARVLNKTRIRKNNTISFDRTDDNWAQITNLSLWLGLIAWAVSLYLSLMAQSDLPSKLSSERTSILIGAILWMTAVAFDILRGGTR